MTKNAIIAELYLSKQFNACIKAVKPESLQDDLKHEVSVIFCEMPESFIIDIHQRGKLQNYATRVIMQQAISSTSHFANKYQRTNKLVALSVAGPQEEFNEEKEKLMIELAFEEVESLYWYERDMIKAYLQYGSYGAVAKAIDIPKTTVFRAIKPALEKIKAKVYANV